MGMRMGGMGSAASAPSVAAWQQRQQSVKDLSSALTAGDLGAAQKAFAGIGGGAGALKGDSPLARIGQALQSGDLAAAQQAGQALQANRSRHRGGADVDQATAAAAPSAPAAPAIGSLTGTIINTTA